MSSLGAAAFHHRTTGLLYQDEEFLRAVTSPNSEGIYAFHFMSISGTTGMQQ
jgi:hypothetical protein